MEILSGTFSTFITCTRTPNELDSTILIKTIVMKLIQNEKQRKHLRRFNVIEFDSELQKVFQRSEIFQQFIATQRETFVVHCSKRKATQPVKCQNTRGIEFCLN